MKDLKENMIIEDTETENIHSRFNKNFPIRSFAYTEIPEPDYDYWCKYDTLTTEAAISLSLGKDPITFHEHYPSRIEPKICEAYIKRINLINQSPILKLGNTVRPIDLVKWLERCQIKFPRILKKAAEICEKDYHAPYRKEQEEKLMAFKIRDKALHKTREKTLLEIIGAYEMLHFGHFETKYTNILSKLYAVGLELSIDTFSETTQKARETLGGKD